MRPRPVTGPDGTCYASIKEAAAAANVVPGAIIGRLHRPGSGWTAPPSARPVIGPDGVTYASAREAAAACGCHPSTIYRRLSLSRSGWAYAAQARQ